jgi:hypothetical protein
VGLCVLMLAVTRCRQLATVWRMARADAPPPPSKPPALFPAHPRPTSASHSTALVGLDYPLPPPLSSSLAHPPFPNRPASIASVTPVVSPLGMAAAAAAAGGEVAGLTWSDPSPQANTRNKSPSGVGPSSQAERSTFESPYVNDVYLSVFRGIW